MIRKTFLLCVILLSLHLTSKAQGINIFHGMLTEAKAEAKKENKFLAIDCYTDWCGWCKFMVRNVFPQKEAGDFYNANFVFYEMNMEQGEGKDVARQYKLQMYPSFLFFDPDGAFVHYYFGAATTPDAFIKVGQTAMDSMHNCRGLAYRFFQGEHDTAFLKQLINTVGYYADPKITEKALSAYWASIPEKEILEMDNWKMWKYYEGDINSIAFNYIYSHQPEFLARYHDKGDSNVIYYKAAIAIKDAADAKDVKTFIKARQIALLSNDEQTRYIICTNEFPFSLKTGNLDDFYKDVDQFIQKFGTEWVWGIASAMGTGTDDKGVLEKALNYDLQALKQGKNYNNTDTYAHLLYKLGRYKEAYNSANEALDLAKKINDNNERARDAGQENAFLEIIRKTDH